MAEIPATVCDKAAWVDLRELDDHGDGLTEWETEFLDALIKRVRAGAILTDRQRETLARIREDRL